MFRAFTKSSHTCAWHHRALAAALTVLLPGCLTPKAVDRWENSRLQKVELTVQEAQPDYVRLLWEAHYELGIRREQQIAFDPGLDDCDAVRVLIDDPTGVVGWGAAARKHPRPCEVIVRVTTRSQGVVLKARSEDRSFGPREIDAPHNHLWLAAIPAAAVADATATVVFFAVIGIAQMDGYRKTWTP